MSKKAFFIRADDRVQEMVEQIKEKNGYTSYTQVWLQAMVEFYNRNFKDYLAPKPRTKQTPEERAQYLQEMEKAKIDIARNKKLDILERLGGTLIANDMVQWYTYYATGKDIQQLPLMSLTEDLINNQFQGNIEKIKKFHKLK